MSESKQSAPASASAEPERTSTHRVGIVMGSRSDWPTMEHAADMLTRLGVAHDVEVVSAHRTPQRLADYAMQARDRGMSVIIAGAGGAAHLPGMLAAYTSLPVLGVPIKSKTLNGLDSLLSIVQMPAGIAVGTLAIGQAGASNAGLFAAQIVALHDAEVSRRIDEFRAEQSARVTAGNDPRLPLPDEDNSDTGLSVGSSIT